MRKKTSDIKPRAGSFDVLMWSVIFLVFATGFWANYYYTQLDWALKLVGWILLTCVILAIALQTAFGKRAWAFSKEARGELRKVFWPTRQETIQTTALVVFMAILAALVLWGIDSLLLWVVSLLMERG
jgi:preprotein translocase subunit SecE